MLPRFFVGGDRMKILCTYNYGLEEFLRWEQLGFEVQYIPEHEIDEATPLANVDILICYSPFKHMAIQNLKGIKYILLSSIGFDQVPKELLNDPNIQITNNHGGYSPPIGEWIVMMLLMGFKKANRLIAYHQNRKWGLETDLLELIDKRILFIGTGTLAQHAAKRLQGFDCEIIGVNTLGKPLPNFKRCVPWTNLKDEIEMADAVVCCLPLTQKTYRLIDEDMLCAMRASSIFINVSRGAVLDEEALIRHLSEGKFRFVALDVFETEPLTAEHALWKFPQVLVTSHQSWVSERRNMRRLETIRYNLESIALGRALKHTVDRERGY